MNSYLSPGNVGIEDVNAPHGQRPTRIDFPTESPSVSWCIGVAGKLFTRSVPSRRSARFRVLLSLAPDISQHCKAGGNFVYLLAKCGFVPEVSSTYGEYAPRWFDGSRHFWSGRTVGAGRDEANSALRFDDTY